MGGKIQMLSAIASIWTAFIATLALRAWGKTANAQKHLEFLDKLIETVYEYIQAMVIPIQIWECSKRGIDIYSDMGKGHGSDSSIDGMIGYIKDHGKDDWSQLNIYLDKVRPITIRLEALAAKGQIFGFNNYKQCFDACRMLLWSFGQLEKCGYFIGNTNHFWENQLVNETMNKIVSVDAESIRQNIQRQNGILLEFSRQAYADALGKKHNYSAIASACLLKAKACIDKLKHNG